MVADRLAAEEAFESARVGLSEARKKKAQEDQIIKDRKAFFDRL